MTKNDFTAPEQDKIFNAITFVAEKHRHHWRKGTRIPYISHLMNVMKILCEEGAPAEIVVAGILHDVVEDTPVSVEEVKQLFGEKIARLVVKASEQDKLEDAENRKKDKETPWRERKEKTIAHLNNEPNPNYLLVSAADKLDDIRAIRADYERIGDAIWSRFNASQDELRWYYTEIAKALHRQAAKHGGPLLSISNKLMAELAHVFPKNNQ
jgi:(p)ppGpp synthase/HD superfamily hydrolase